MAQTILHGIKSLFTLLKGKDYLLVCDPSFKFLDFAGELTPKAVFNAFTSNPLYEQVCEGVKAFNGNGCDTIVAIGGGSTMDVAKCVKLYAKMDPVVNYLEQTPFDSGIPLFAVPTTAGTGSESTRHAVIYFNGEKQSISHPSIVPNVAVLEPSVLKTLPLYQKKCTMLDALCQGIESWWSVNSTMESIGYSHEAVRLILANWQAYIEDNSQKAASQIMLAANYAGRAINITATTAPHAMSYKLTSMFGLPHGHAVAVCLPEVWEYMKDHVDSCVDKRGEGHLKNVLQTIPFSPEDFRKLLENLEIQSPVSRHREADVTVLASSVNPVRLKNNPVPLSAEVLMEMYERSVK